MRCFGCPPSVGSCGQLTGTLRDYAETYATTRLPEVPDYPAVFLRMVTRLLRLVFDWLDFLTFTLAIPCQHIAVQLRIGCSAGRFLSPDGQDTHRLYYGIGVGLPPALPSVQRSGLSV